MHARTDIVTPWASVRAKYHIEVKLDKISRYNCLFTSFGFLWFFSLLEILGELVINSVFIPSLRGCLVKLYKQIMIIAMDRTLHSLIILHGRLYWPPDIKTPVDKHEVKSISTWVSLLTNETCSNLPGPTFVICYHKINPCSGPRLSQVTSPSFRKRLSLKGLSLSTANLVYLHWDPIVLNGSYIHWWQDLGLGNKHSEVFGGAPTQAL